MEHPRLGRALALRTGLGWMEEGMASTHDPADRGLEALVSCPKRRKRLLERLQVEDRRALLRQLQAHVEVHLAQGHRLAAHVLLGISAEVAGDSLELQYGVERTRIRWLEQEGLGDDALAAMSRLYEVHRRRRSPPERGAELAMELGILLDRSGRKKEALKLFRNAAARYHRMNQPYNRAAALFNAASVLYDLGRVGPSLRVCREALEQGGEGHLDMEAHIALQMANSHELQGHLDQAVESYQMAAEGYGGLQNRRQESSIRYRLGWLALQRGLPAEAWPQLQQALEVRREHDYGTGLARYHLARAESYRTAGLPESARVHFRACVSLAVALGNEALATRARFGLCRLAGGHLRSLPSYLKLPAPTGGEESIHRGRKGVYCRQIGEGASQSPWSQSGDAEPPPEDRPALARLLKDLARSLRLEGLPDSEQIHRQERAVQAWQSNPRKPRRAGPGPTSV